MFILILFISSAHHCLGQYNTIEGIWLVEDKKGKVEITKNGEYYDAKLIWKSWDTPDYDIYNTNLHMRGAALLGKTLAKELRLLKDGRYEGNIYDPKSGKHYPCLIWRDGEELLVRGYWGVLYDTQKWTRVGESKE